jgi:hypothetical protein
MDWFRRIAKDSPPVDATREARKQTPSVSGERTSPALAAFFDRVSEDRSHAVLDLGPASEASMRLFGRYARWIRFADLSDAETAPGGWEAALASLPRDSTRPFDLIFAWDIFDRLEPERRPALMARITELTAPDARLYVAVDASARPETAPLRFSLLDSDRMRYEQAGPPRPPFPRMLPTEVERMLEPFRVIKAFTSQLGLREYVAIRGKG